MSALLDPLPVDAALPQVRAALASPGAAVLQAPPGAGKTTRVPLALLGEQWLGGGRIVLLEPRRLAARAAAARMADLLGQRPGETVGYRIRHETRIGPRTRIEVVTEGVLTRMLQNDAALEGIGLVIFDEFHERSLHADLGLAFTLQTRAILREDLRVLVMSATLDGAPVAAMLGGAPVIRSHGRAYPVETRYLPPVGSLRLEPAVAAAVRHALQTDPGDVLAFLPGAGEIRRAACLLADLDADVIPLHGTLTQALQDRALRPASNGRRRVVLATSIAETSLTVDGIRVVVDGGYARVPRYSVRTAMTRLATVRVSRASADQRRGRAGRQAPGVCYRLWSAHEDHALLPRATPEILEADLTPLALELSVAEIRDPAELPWLDAPPPAALNAARTLLRQLGAIDDAGQVTSHGRAVHRFALHPRLAHMVLRARELGAGKLACELAALLSERDILRGRDGPPEADLTVRLDLLRGAAQRADVDHEALRRARAEARICGEAAGRRHAGGEQAADVSPGLLLAFAYPDRVAQRRRGPQGRFLLRNGQGARIDDGALAGEACLVAAVLEGREAESRIALGAPLTLSELVANFANDVERVDVLGWDPGVRAVVALRREHLGALVLRETALQHPDPLEVTRAFMAGIRQQGIPRLPWSDPDRRLRERLAFLHGVDRSWPDVSDEALAADLEAWLGPALGRRCRWEELEELDLGGLLVGRLGWAQRAALDDWAPSHIEVPSGSRISVEYGCEGGPVLAVRIQELFGLSRTPTVAGGRVPVTLHLLSPARRPVQVTRDLAGFWRSTYFEVRKDLKGRYPRHEWPDDPLQAPPTRESKRRGRRGT